MRCNIALLAFLLVMETNHVSIDRLRDIALDDAVTFTQIELDHVRQCVDCFGEWATIIETLESNLFH